MLGGSSGINHTAWSRAAAPEYDALSAFASTSPGWDWEGLLPYLKKAERVSVEPTNTYPGISEQRAEKAREDFEKYNGTSGPIMVCTVFESSTTSFSLLSKFKIQHEPFRFPVVDQVVETFNNLGIQTNPEPVRCVRGDSCLTSLTSSSLLGTLRA